MPEITRSVTRAVTAAAELVAGPMVLAGHSAGGHLATRMICADTGLAPAVTDRIRRVVSISGLHDLRPLLRTERGKDQRLDAAIVRSESPALLDPLPGVTHIAWVGAFEKQEFLRQSALIANAWAGCGVATGHHVAPDRHHFDVIDDLRDPGSDLTRVLLAD